MAAGLERSAWAMITSAPARAARTASATEPTCTMIETPARCAGSMKGVGSPQNNDSAATLSSMQTRIPSSCGKCRTKFTPKGPLVSVRKRRISSRKCAGGPSCACSIPKPPARHTAATNSTPLRSGPMGATTIGASMPKRSQKRVRSMAHLFYNFPRRLSKNGEGVLPGWRVKRLAYWVLAQRQGLARFDVQRWRRAASQAACRPSIGGSLWRPPASHPPSQRSAMGASRQP